MRFFAVAFAIFDQNGDGYIDETELIVALQMTNKRGMTDEQLQHIVGALMQKWDKSGDGKLIYPEFRELLTNLANQCTLTLIPSKESYVAFYGRPNSAWIFLEMSLCCAQLIKVASKIVTPFTTSS